MQFLLRCNDFSCRCRDLDSELNSTHQKLVKLEQQHVMLTQTIRTELDVLVETGETTSEHKYSDSIGGGGGSDLLTDITVGIVVMCQVCLIIKPCICYHCCVSFAHHAQKWPECHHTICGCRGSIWALYAVLCGPIALHPLSCSLTSVNYPQHGSLIL